MENLSFKGSENDGLHKPVNLKENFNQQKQEHFM